MKTSTTKRSRILLTHHSECKAQKWKQTLQGELFDTTIHITTLVNLIIENLDENLPAHIEAKIKEALYDPIKAVEWAAKKAREEKKNGEEVGLEDILMLIKPKKATRRPRRATSKDAQTP